jgi:putative oxidoreductase
VNLLNRLSSQAHWLLRLALASVFIYHGVMMLRSVFAGGEGPGIPTAEALAIGLIQVLSSLLILIGGIMSDWLTRIGCLLLLGLLGYFSAVIHWGQWSFIATSTHPAGGMEFPAVLMAVCLYLLLWQRETKQTSPL